MKKSKFVLLLFVFSILIVSCKKELPVLGPMNTGQPNQEAVGTLDLGNNVSAKFHGLVVDESDNPVSDVQITIGTSTTTTDANGQFVLENIDVPEKLAYVKADKAGYFPGSRSLIPSQTAFNYVKIELMEETVIGTVSSGEQKSLSMNGGASVDFKGMYVDGNGYPYEGEVTVVAKFLPALAPETSDQMPGMLYAENSQGESGALITYGMMVVELYGESGQELNIAQGSFATINVPVDQQQMGSAPETIPLWHFDEVAGYWVEEGEANLIDGKYVGNVKHFSFWNCDVFGDDCEHHGTVTDNQNNPLSGAMVHIDAGGGNVTTGYTNSDGTFFTYLPANQNIQMDVSYGCNTTVTSYNVGPYTSNSVNYETYISDVGTGGLHVTATVEDCNQNPIDGAYGYIYTNNIYVNFTSINGVVDVVIPNCSGAQSFYFTISDYLQGNGTYSDPNVSIVLPTTDLGLITLCDTSGQGGGGQVTDCDPNEFYELTVDGNVVQSDTCVYFMYNDTLTSTGFGVGGASNGFSGVFSTVINTTGTFTGSDVQNPAPTDVVFLDINDMDIAAVHNFTTNITTYDGPGGYISLTLTGTYIDTSQVSHSVQVICTAYIPN